MLRTENFTTNWRLVSSHLMVFNPPTHLGFLLKLRHTVTHELFDVMPKFRLTIAIQKINDYHLLTVIILDNILIFYYYVKIKPSFLLSAICHMLMSWFHGYCLTQWPYFNFKQLFNIIPCPSWYNHQGQWLSMQPYNIIIRSSF